MASVYKRTYRNRQGEATETTRWYVEFADHTGVYQRLPAFADRRASDELGRKLDRLAGLRASGEQPDATLLKWLEGLPGKLRDKLTRFGLLEGRSAATSRPIREHIADYLDSLSADGRTAEYVKKMESRMTAIVDGLGMRYLTGLSAAKVSRYLADRRSLDRKQGGISVKTSNHYLAAVKGFLNWMVRECRASENPLAHLRALNAETDRQHVRRALEADELRRVLTATRTGPKRCGMNGEERYWLYRLAAETGLRAGEIRSLTRADFDLSGDESTVNVGAKNAKNRKAATLPLRMSTAHELRPFLANKHPRTNIFNLPRPEKVVVMLRADLEAAGVQYRDDADRVADFHSLRKSFATLLLRAGVDVRTARDLMRHSTIQMTADVYACRVKGADADAIERLPDLTPHVAAVATGTDDEAAVTRQNTDELSGGPTGGNTGTRRCTTVQRDARHRPHERKSEASINTKDMRKKDCRTTPCDNYTTVSVSAPPRGVEPLSPA